MYGGVVPLFPGVGPAYSHKYYHKISKGTLTVPRLTDGLRKKLTSLACNKDSITEVIQDFRWQSRKIFPGCGNLPTTSTDWVGKAAKALQRSRCLGSQLLKVLKAVVQKRTLHGPHGNFKAFSGTLNKRNRAFYVP